VALERIADGVEQERVPGQLFTHIAARLVLRKRRVDPVHRDESTIVGVTSRSETGSSRTPGVKLGCPP